MKGQVFRGYPWTTFAVVGKVRIPFRGGRGFDVSLG